MAGLDLRAGRKAKASVAYASACGYLAAGMALFGEEDWKSRYEQLFGLWRECAECELLRGDFDTAKRLIATLLRNATSKLDPRYGPFVNQLRVLARSYQSKAILDLVERCLKGCQVQ